MQKQGAYGSQQIEKEHQKRALHRVPQPDQMPYFHNVTFC
jgi:hypothetical protein